MKPAGFRQVSVITMDAEGEGTGDVVQKRFVRGSATTAAYLVDKAANMAL
jgi:hypothetical protein